MSIDNKFIGMGLAEKALLAQGQDSDELKKGLRKQSTEDRRNLNTLLDELIAADGYFKSDLPLTKAHNYQKLELEVLELTEENAPDKSDKNRLDTNNQPLSKQKYQENRDAAAYCSKLYRSFRRLMGWDVSKDTIIAKLNRLKDLRSRSQLLQWNTETIKDASEIALAHWKEIDKDYMTYERAVGSLSRRLRKLIEPLFENDDNLNRNLNTYAQNLIDMRDPEQRSLAKALLECEKCLQSPNLDKSLKEKLKVLIEDTRATLYSIKIDAFTSPAESSSTRKNYLQNWQRKMSCLYNQTQEHLAKIRFRRKSLRIIETNKMDREISAQLNRLKSSLTSEQGSTIRELDVLLKRYQGHMKYESIVQELFDRLVALETFYARKRYSRVDTKKKQDNTIICNVSKVLKVLKNFELDEANQNLDENLREELKLLIKNLKEFLAKLAKNDMSPRKIVRQLKKHLGEIQSNKEKILVQLQYQKVKKDAEHYYKRRLDNLTLIKKEVEEQQQFCTAMSQFFNEVAETNASQSPKCVSDKLTNMKKDLKILIDEFDRTKGIKNNLGQKLKRDGIRNSNGTLILESKLELNDNELKLLILRKKIQNYTFFIKLVQLIELTFQESEEVNRINKKVLEDFIDTNFSNSIIVYKLGEELINGLKSSYPRQVRGEINTILQKHMEQTGGWSIDLTVREEELKKKRLELDNQLGEVVPSQIRPNREKKQSLSTHSTTLSETGLNLSQIVDLGKSKERERGDLSRKEKELKGLQTTKTEKNGKQQYQSSSRKRPRWEGPAPVYQNTKKLSIFQ